LILAIVFGPLFGIALAVIAYLIMANLPQKGEASGNNVVNKNGLSLTNTVSATEGQNRA